MNSLVDSEKLTWYVARAGGLVAWALLAAAMILGLALSSRLLGRKAHPAWLQSVHRFVGGLSVWFTGIHVGAVVLDDFVDFGLVEVLVPMASTWRPGAIAWGVVALWLVCAVEATSLSMRRLPRRLWRAVHWSSAALYVTASVHAWQAGTDVGQVCVAGASLVSTVLAALTMARVVVARRRPERRGPARPVAVQRTGASDERPFESRPVVSRTISGPVEAAATTSRWSEPDTDAHLRPALAWRRQARSASGRAASGAGTSTPQGAEPAMPSGQRAGTAASGTSMRSPTASIPSSS